MPASRPDEPGGGVRLRTVTWNIHGAVGGDGRQDDESVFAAIERFAPDILALQEIDGRAHLGRKPYAFERYRDRLGDHVAEARTVPATDGRDFGHVLWSRWPIEAAWTLTLPGPCIERRMALCADIAVDGRPIHMVAVHLGLVPLARRRQAAFLARHVVRQARPVIVMGDTNEWNPRGGIDRRLGSLLPRQVVRRSWPSRRPFVAMDRIYADAAFRLDDAWIDRSAALASDHRALGADWTLAQGI